MRVYGIDFIKIDMINNDRAFFNYYLPALKEALDKDSEYKDPSWFYPDGISQEMDMYEEKIYHKYPIIDMAYIYFNAKSHGFGSINLIGQNIDIEAYRQKLITFMQIISKQFKILI